jgi:hypothetical protein
MPFLPFVLLIAWQAFSRSASFALGWATAIYFGQVPGRQGRILSVISLLSAGWVILIFGFAIPILTGAALEAAGIIEDNFDVEPLHYLGLAAGLVLIPPIVAASAVWAELLEERTIKRWLRQVPISYPATFMLGISVVLMVLFTPVLLFQRWRRKRKLVDVALVMRKGTDDDDLREALERSLDAIGIDEVRVSESRGPKSWPLRTMGFASEHLLGAVVRGKPLLLEAGEIEIRAYATNVSILGPKEEAYRIRAAIERELAFSDAYLTWGEESQKFEDALLKLHRGADGDLRKIREKLDRLQEKMDVASLNSEEWNVLYRLRLQVEQEATRPRRRKARE